MSPFGRIRTGRGKIRPGPGMSAGERPYITTSSTSISRASCPRTAAASSSATSGSAIRAGTSASTASRSSWAGRPSAATTFRGRGGPRGARPGHPARTDEGVGWPVPYASVDRIRAMPIDRRTLLSLAAASLAHSGFTSARPGPTKTSEVKTAGIRLIPVDGRYKVWTKKLGKGPIQMLTLHGGPGVTHEYFECFEDFLPQAGVEFYYYDQLGSFYSDQPDDPSLWTIDRFREEVEQVRAALGLENFIPLRPVMGQHARDRVRAEVPEAPEGPGALEHDGLDPVLHGLRREAPRRVAEADARHTREVRSRGQVRRARVPGSDVRGRLQAPRLPSRPVAGSRGARLQAHQQPGLRNDAGTQRIRRDRDLQGLGPLERPREDQGSRRSSSARRTTR